MSVPMSRFRYISMQTMLESEAMWARLYGAKVFSTSLGLKIDLEFLNKLRMGSSGLFRQNFLQNYQFILLHPLLSFKQTRLGTCNIILMQKLSHLHSSYRLICFCILRQGSKFLVCKFGVSYIPSQLHYLTFC